MGKEIIISESEYQKLKTSNSIGFDKSIILSEIEYQKKLEEIDIDIHKNLDAHIYLLFKDKYFDFIHDKLGIRVAGFMIYDSYSTNHILYENNLIDFRETFYPKIPYQLNKGGYEEIIDLAFYADRHPKIKNRNYKEKVSDVPEFHKFFQKDYRPDSVEKNIMHEFQNFNGEPRKNPKAIKYFHRPAGEVLFFLYAWRYLVRLSSKLQSSTLINSFETFFYSKYSKPLCPEADWFKLTTVFDFSDSYDIFQKDLTDKLDRLEKLNTQEKEKKENIEEKKNLISILERTKVAFIEYQKYEYNVLDNTEFTDTDERGEWGTLGINPYHERGRLSLKALLEYASKIASHSGDSTKATERKKVRNVLKNTLEQINNANWEEIKQDEIHEALAYIFYSLFTIEGKDGKGTTYEDVFKNKFFKIAQFPIFPYFLEIFFDKNQDDSKRSKWHSPKEHLVFPIWYSKPAIGKDSKQDISRYVAYVLLSMEPVWSFTDCFESYDDKEIHELNILRIKNLFQVVNKTLVEKGFYNNVVKKQILIPAIKAAEIKILSRNFSHHIGSHVMPNVSLKQIKARYKELCGSSIDDEFLDILKSRLDIYITERNEFLCDPGSPFKSVLFYSQTIIPFVENVLLQDNLCRSEGLGFAINGGNDIKIQVRIGNDDVIAKFGTFEYPDKLPYNGTYNASEKTSLSAKIEVSDVPIALPNTHIIFSILENFIRNTAKHQKREFNRIENGVKIKEKLEVIINLEESDDHSYWLTISDNVSKVGKLFLDKQYANIIDDESNEIAQKDLGIIDFKICAGLLNKKSFEEVDNSIFEIIVEESGKLSYRFKILKPKDICLIGYNAIKADNYKTFDFYSNAVTFIKAVKNSVPYQFYLIKEKELENLMLDESNAKLLPFRVLVEMETNQASKYWKEEKYGRKYLFTSSIGITKTPEEILAKCWTQWLYRWGINSENKSELIVYSDEKLEGWNNNALQSKVLGFRYGYGKDNNDWRLKIEELSTDYPKVFYDHHGGGLSNAQFPKERSFLSSNAYIPFGKNSKDQAFITQSNPKENWLLPFQLIEAGLSRILIIDERFVDIAHKLYEGNISKETLVKKGKFRYAKYTENFTKLEKENWVIHNIDSYWAANVIVASQLNNKPIKPELFSKEDEHSINIDINEKTVSSYPNFDYLKRESCKIIDADIIKEQTYEAIVIHRTFLNDESLKTYWGNKKVEDVLGILNKHFPLVLITSGGGDVITFKGDFKFISFNEVLYCMSVPENIGKLQFVKNIYSK